MLALLDTSMVLIGLLAIFLIVIWTIFPFAVFGIKERLDTLIQEQQKTNELLYVIRKNTPASPPKWE